MKTKMDYRHWQCTETTDKTVYCIFIHFIVKNCSEGKELVVLLKHSEPTHSDSIILKMRRAAAKICQEVWFSELHILRKKRKKES